MKSITKTLSVHKVVYAVGILLVLALYAVASVAFADSNVMPYSPTTNPDEDINICYPLPTGDGYTQNNYIAEQITVSNLKPLQFDNAIVPPFEYDFDGVTGTFPGQNWDDFQSIWYKDCVLPADLEVVKTVDVDTPAVGGEITYTVTVTNIGQSEATNVVLTDQFDAGLTFVSADPQADAIPPYTWNVGSLGAGASYEVDVTLSVDAGQEGNTLSNNANVDTDSDESSLANNNAEVDVTVALGDPVEEVATIFAHKIVCTDETELPNGDITKPIDINTAKEWVKDYDSCDFESDWDFEWKAGAKDDPGDTETGPAGGDWTTFDFSTDIYGETTQALNASDLNGESRIWFREILEPGYLTFTHGPSGDNNSNNVTAEFYCHNDAVNYDNLEWIGEASDPITLGETYYCVAWNVPTEPQEPETETIEICKIDGTSGEGEGVLYTDGWNMTLTNNKDSEDLVEYNLTTGETGCVSQDVDPTDGPWTVTEEKVDGWELVHLDATGGVLNAEVDPTGCTFFSAPVGIEVARFVSDEAPVQETGHACTFVNAQEEAGPYDMCRTDNLLTNGSFEDVEVTANGGVWEQFASTTIGWFVEKVSDATETLLELHRGWSGNEAAQGEQYAELDGDEPTQISQPVTTESGAEYKLWWAFAPRQNTSADENNLSVLVGGVEVATEGPTAGDGVLTEGDWTHNSYTFIGDGNNVDIAFKDLGTDSNVNNVKDPDVGTFLDDTYLCKVKEPEEEPNDVCSNINGIQTELPQGHEFTDENICTPIDDGDSNGGGSSGGGSLLKTRDDSGDNDTPDGDTRGASDSKDEDDDKTPKGEVEGAQTSIVPTVAGANTGAGGTSNTPTPFVPVMALFGILTSFAILRLTPVNEM